MYGAIPVEEIMVDDVVTASPDTPAIDGARLLCDREVSSVVIVREGDDDPVGIVTEGDFVTSLCERRDLETAALSDVMSSPVTTVEPRTSVVDAATILRTEDLEHLPVVDAGLVGIVTTIELSHFVPQLHHPVHVPTDEPPRRRVRTDTLYERDDWAFEYHGADETTVSVGDVARFSKTLSETDVEEFAEASGDTNRLHLDAEYAAATRFGERIVHGTLAAGLISAALARLPGLTIYLSQESSFRGPLSIGERATAVCEVVDDLSRSKYRIATSIEDADGEVVVDGEAVVLVDELPPESALARDEA